MSGVSQIQAFQKIVNNGYMPMTPVMQKMSGAKNWTWYCHAVKDNDPATYAVSVDGGGNVAAVPI